MVLTLLMLIPLRQATADSVLDRMKATLLKPFSVSYEMTRENVPGSGVGSVTIVRPNRLSYQIKWGSADFEYYASENHGLEIIRSRKIYLESTPLDKLYQPTSGYTMLAEDAFPLILMLADPRAMFGKLPTKLLGTESINGVTCDHVRGGTDASGYDAYVDALGKLIRFRFDLVERAGKISLNFNFKDYAMGKDFPLSTFEPPIPADFNPSGFTKAGFALIVGSPFPKGTWQDVKGKAVNLSFKKPVLVVVTDAECEPSERAAGALEKLSKVLPVWLFTDSGKAPKGLGNFPIYRDPSGHTQERFFAPGTPLFFLVGADGKVKRLWLGFDPAEEAAFVKEVQAALES